jgi:hypothetical protein
MELNAAAFVTQRAAAGWLALRLDLLGVLVILLTCEGHGASLWVGGVHHAMWGCWLFVNQKRFFTFVAQWLWCAGRSSLLTLGLTFAPVVCCCSCAAVLSISGGISPALAGLCLVYALDMTVSDHSKCIQLFCQLVLQVTCM